AHWLDTRSGLSIERGGVVHDVPLYSNTSRGLVRPSWSSALEDREGGLWFASSETGLWHLPANWRNFTVLRRQLDDPETSANAFVYSGTAARDGGLWLVGTGGVLDWPDPHTVQLERRPIGVCGDLVPYVVREMADRSVWIGCHGAVTRYVPGTGEIRRWRRGDATDATPGGIVGYIVGEPDGTVWLGATDALQRRAPDGRVLQVLEAGGPEGFPANNALRRCEPVPGGPDWQGLAFGLGADGTVWVGGNGVLMSYRWTGVELIAERAVDARHGLPAVAPGGLVADDLGVVWMSTPRGLVRYDPAHDRLRLYSALDGLPSQQLSEYHFAPSACGYTAAGTAGGLLPLHPPHGPAP